VVKLGRRRDTRPDGADDSPEAQLLRRTGLFSDVDPRQLQEIAERLHRVTYGDGERIVEEGDFGDGFYVIERGTVRISGAEAHGGEIVLARLEPGQYFGEQALVDEIPSRRTASATAIGETDVLRLEQSDFRHVLESSRKVEQSLRARGAEQVVEKWTRQHPMFGSLDRKLLERLARNVRDFEPGSVIFSQGDAADGVYFIADGEVRIEIAVEGAESRETTLVPGQMFGELGSLYSVRRAGTAIATTRARTLFFDGKQFRKLYDSRPDVADWVRDAQRIYEIPNRGVVSVFEGEYQGVSCLTSAFHLHDGRTVSASKVRGDELFVLAEEGAPDGRVLRWEKDLQRRELTVVDGRITAIVCHGYWGDLERACAMALDATQLDGWRESLFRDSGRLEIVEPQESNDPDALLCNCMRITRGRVREVIDGGDTELDAVTSATGAGTVCGGCRPKIGAMLGNTLWEPVRVVEVIEHAPDVRSYRLTPYAGEMVPYEVGQHVVIQSLIDERFISRTYTLTSHPSLDSYEITVKREPQGYFSGWLFERAGKEPFLRIASPSGTGIHTLADDAPVVCLVAGIGVTPAVALARHIDHHSSAQRLHIDYSARTREDLVFADELRAIERRRANVSTQMRLTSEDGRLGSTEIEQLVNTFPTAGFFVCGPRPYHAGVTALLQSSGVPPERVCSEEFRHAAGPESRTGA
jgi:ferredoxin-NADP reductase/CRP-like cAMP-binding protein